MSATKTTKSLYRIIRNPPSTPRTNPTPSKHHDLLIQSLYNDQNLTSLVENFKKCSEIHSFRKQHRIYRVTVLRFASAERFSSIEEILQHQKKYDCITSEGFAVRLISLYGKAVQFNKVEELFIEMPLKLSISPDTITYNIVIQALCENGSFDSAESMLAEMESNGVTPSLITFNTIMHGFYFNGRFSDGDRIRARMEKSGIATDIASYNGKMQGLRNAGKISEAVELFKELESRKEKPDLISYNFLIKAYCNDGNLVAAIKTYNRLLKKGYIPNRSTLEMLIPSICKKGNIHHASKLCEKNVSVNCYISVGTLQTVVDVLVQASRTEEAEQLVKLATSKTYGYYLQVKMPSN